MAPLYWCLFFYSSLSFLPAFQRNGVSTAEVLNSMPSAQVILRETFGYQQFRPGQQEIIDTIITGRDCLVVMPTGGENHFAIKFLLFCLMA